MELVYTVDAVPDVAAANNGYLVEFVVVSSVIVAPPPMDDQAEPLYPSKELVVVLYRILPTTPVGCWAVVPDGSCNAPVDVNAESDVAVKIVKVPAAAVVPPIAGGEAKYVLNPVPETVELALKVVNAPAPEKLVADKTPVLGTYCNFVELTYSVEIVPVVALVNNIYRALDVDVSSVIAIDAVGFVHVGTLVPFEVKTWPVVPAAVNPVAPAADCQGTAPATPPAKLVDVVAVDADPTDKVDCAT